MSHSLFSLRAGVQHLIGCSYAITVMVPAVLPSPSTWLIPFALPGWASYRSAISILLLFNLRMIKSD